ncbi:Major facilitator superfamily multidrug transporter mfsC [Exophiala dermatitidis]|uniref:MFS transporter, DHA2 family, methylenomycin A resistance protein n=1 Tax=Exophiala dermatitidis (strain ATCC 34100 / CBS 525.76 / NIH/UT8656) TaxID=858893 RepID=H6BKY4_EXODN|nr:MFS transporter, DHA2 family, methylenomycin A resistance protein [Exophiala dermatitidis NIH/UT8656]EHY51785.1 MFS transporter, DHA2 family, methylenomycin A resistance protein [Exophiala dermatitidis NIH/UT8656]
MAKLPYSEYKDAGFLRWLVLGIACVANFADLFQSSMVLFGLPAIAADSSMNFSPTDINWVIVAYTVTFATFLGIGGQCADRTGPRNTFIVGLCFLVWTNILCAWAPNQSAFLAGRALAGVGAALTAATGIPIITRLFPEEKERTTGLSIYISCAPLGTILGVVIGAALSISSVGWRSLFWVTMILAVIALVFAFLFVPAFEIASSDKPPIDYLGLTMFTLGTCLLVYGLNDAENRGWKSAPVITTIVLGALTLIGFPFVEARLQAPFIPRTILFNRHAMVPACSFMFTGGGWITWLFLATQICLNSLKYSTILAACYFLPAAFASVIGGGIANTLVNMKQTSLLIVGGYTLSVGALIPWGVIGPQYGIWYVIVFSALYLFSSPIVTVGAQALVLQEVPVEDHGRAAALTYVLYQFGSSLFLAVANILIGSTSKGETPQGLLVGYRNAIWSLVGFTSVGLASFVVLYLPGQSKKVVESQAAGTVNEPGSNKPEPLGEL